MAEGLELKGKDDERFAAAGGGVLDDVTHRPIGTARSWQNAPK
jgi:hypothetical protein